MRTSIVVFALIVAACGGQVATTPSIPAPETSTPADPSHGTTAGPSPASVASLDPSTVPPGRIAYMRVDADEVERYFTVTSVGADERLLFETTGCACIRWSPDGSQIWTVTDVDGVLRFTTRDPDGNNVQIHVPRIKTLSLAPGFGSADGRHVAFFGWDDTHPERLGVWAARTDLSDLHLVTPIPDGVLGVDPIGMSADGAFIYFHGDLGENTDNEFHHAGNVYVIGTDGTGLRQLNPVGTKTEITGTGLSPDGRHFAFTAWQVGKGALGNALFVVDGADGNPLRVTDWTPGLWGASWAPTSDWLALTQVIEGPVASIIRPDGSGLRTIAPAGVAEAVFGPVWSPDGTHFLVRRGTQHRNDLWVIDLEGMYVWQVTHRPAAYDIYHWAGPSRAGE